MPIKSDALRPCWPTLERRASEIRPCDNAYQADWIKVDLHLHTHRSRDCSLSIKAILQAAQEQSLGALAVTDHNTIRGALELADVAPFSVIIGEEIKTSQGEIIGLFLQEEIPPGLSPQETVAAIRAQGGLISIPHPLDRLRGSALKRQALYAILNQVDIIEVFNARVLLRADNLAARELATKNGIPGAGGSDAHSASEIGRAYVLMPPFSGRDSFLEQLRYGYVVGEPSPIWAHFLSTWAKWERR